MMKPSTEVIRYVERLYLQWEWNVQETSPWFFLPHPTYYYNISYGPSEQFQVWSRISLSASWASYPLYRWIKVKYLLLISNDSWGIRPSLIELLTVHESIAEELPRWFLEAICCTVVSTQGFLSWLLLSWSSISTSPTSPLRQGVNLASLKTSCLTHLNLLPYPP